MGWCVVVVLLLSLCVSVFASPCAKHKSCGACVAERNEKGFLCTWCPDEGGACVPVISIKSTAQTHPTEESDALSSAQVDELDVLDGHTRLSIPSAELDHPFGAQLCRANWRVHSDVWQQDTNNAVAWSVSHCNVYETDAQAALEQTFGYEAETSVFYRSESGGRKHAKLASNGHGQITLDYVAPENYAIEFVNFPPVTILSQGQQLDDASEYFSDACKEIGTQGLDILSEVILQDEELSRKALNKLRPMLGMRKDLEDRADVWIPAGSVTHVEEEKGQMLPPYAFLDEVRTFEPTTDAEQERCVPENAVLATLQFTASIPLKSFLDVLGKEDKYIHILSNGATQLTAAARCLRDMPEETLSRIMTEVGLSSTAVWTTELKSVTAMLAYYVSAFQDKASNVDRETCHLPNPKDDTLKFNIRSNFYDLFRAIYTLQYKGEDLQAAFPIQRSDDLLAILEAVTKHCRLISPGGCPFKNVLLGGGSNSRVLPSGKQAVVQMLDWLIELIDGKRDVLKDAHKSLAALPVQFRGGEPAVIIEFRTPRLSSTRCGLLPAAAALYYEYIGALLTNKPHSELDILIERIEEEVRKQRYVCDVDKRSLRSRSERSPSLVDRVKSTAVSAYNTAYNTAYNSVVNSVAYVWPSNPQQSKEEEVEEEAAEEVGAEQDGEQD